MEIQNIDFGIYALYANGQVMAIYNTAFSELFNTVKNDEFIRKLCFWVTFELSPGVTKTIKLCEGETFQFTDPTEEYIYLTQPVIANFTNPSGGGVTNITFLPGTQFKLNVDVTDFKKIRVPFNWADYVWNNVTKRYEKVFNKNKINVFIDSKTKNIVGRNSAGNMVPIKVITVSSEYNYDNVLTVVGENNIPELAEWHVYGNEQQGRFLTVYPYNPSNPNITFSDIVRYGEKPSLDIQNGIFARELGSKAYELKDHLGNVRTTFSDIKMPKTPPNGTYEVDLLSKSEYYPYGMQIEDLSYQTANSRFSYNSQEKDIELYQNINQLKNPTNIFLRKRF